MKILILLLLTLSSLLSAELKFDTITKCVNGNSYVIFTQIIPNDYNRERVVAVVPEYELREGSTTQLRTHVGKHTEYVQPVLVPKSCKTLLTETEPQEVLTEAQKLQRKEHFK